MSNSHLRRIADGAATPAATGLVPSRLVGGHVPGVGGAVAWENTPTRAREEPVGAANRKSPRKTHPPHPVIPDVGWSLTIRLYGGLAGAPCCILLALFACLNWGVMLESSLLPPDSWQKGRQDHCRPKWKEEKGGMRFRHFLVGLKQLAAASRSDFRRRRSRQRFSRVKIDAPRSEASSGNN